MCIPMKTRAAVTHHTLDQIASNVLDRTTRFGV